MLPKFRAWHKEDKSMCKVVSMSWNDEFTPSLVGVGLEDDQGRYAGYIDELYEIELMQWTGLKDCTGIDIYDSDIVKWNLKDRIGVMRCIPTEGYGIVTNDNGLYMVERPKYFGTFMLHDSQKYLTIIGNIYQNGDLLNV